MALSHGTPGLHKEVRRTPATTLPCRATHRFHQDEVVIHQVMRGSQEKWFSLTMSGSMSKDEVLEGSPRDQTSHILWSSQEAAPPLVLLRNLAQALDLVVMPKLEL
jgi:hypothetical protein